MDDTLLISQAAKLGDLLKKPKRLLVTAESCTGGYISQIITAVAGSSNWFERGFVTYTEHAKQEMLGVSAECLQQYGVVSEQTAQAMAQGALQNSPGQVAVSVTGVAGPDGGTEETPVGTVFIAVADNTSITVNHCTFQGDRAAVRHQTVATALNMLLSFCE